MAAVALIATTLVTGCGGPTRIYSNPPKENGRAPQRVLVLHHVFDPKAFSPRLVEDLAACGVAAKAIEVADLPKEKIRGEGKRQAEMFKADHAIEVNVVSSESDNMGPRSRTYRVTLTDLAEMKEVWTATMMLFIRRIQRSGTEKDLADDLVWGMADARIFSGCPPRPETKG